MIRLEQLLKEKRLKKGFTLEEAAVATKIKAQFLESIEKGAYNELPSPAYAKGFVLNYAEFLGLPKTQVTPLFKRDFDEKKALKVLPDGMVGAKGFPTRRMSFRKFVLAGVIILLISAFFIFQTRSILFAPSISLNAPEEGAVVSREVEVRGKADRAATVTVNDETVPVDENGEFVKKIMLFPGEATIEIKAANRSNKESVVIRSVSVK
jgi:cytoskeletal protein RodZ